MLNLEDTEAMFQGLLEAVPSLKEPYEEHAEFYGGLLDHLFMADVYRFALSRLEENGSGDAQLTALLNYLDKAFRTAQGSDPDSPVANVIAVSFIEYMPPELAAILPPSLAEELARQERSVSNHATEVRQSQQNPGEE